MYFKYFATLKTHKRKTWKKECAGRLVSQMILFHGQKHTSESSGLFKTFSLCLLPVDKVNKLYFIIFYIGSFLETLSHSVV